MRTRQQQIDEQLKQIPDILKKTYLKAVSGKSRNSAIKAFCQYCFGFDSNYRDDIRNCTDMSCPLYPYRPYRNIREPKVCPKSIEK